MAAEANLGRWEAREVEAVPIATPAGPGNAGSEPLAGPPPGHEVSGGGAGNRNPAGSDQGGGRNGRSFWSGVLVGLIPLVLLVGGFIGYQLTTGGDGGSGDQTAVNAGDTSTSGAETAPTTATSLTVETVPVPTPTSSTVDAETVVQAEPVVAEGVVADGAVEVNGVLPDANRSQWIGEVADLAAVLGYRLDDRTENATGAAAEAERELLVRFPGAVVFAEGSPSFFDGEAQPVFEAVAGVLNRGSARLHIVAYADPSAPEDAVLALSRAEHVHEHLLELGVDAARLTVEARPPVEAPIVAAEDSPIERRADLEFRFAS